MLLKETPCPLRGQFEILENGIFTVLEIYARERHVFVKFFINFILQWKNQLCDSVFYSCFFQVRPRHQLLFQEKPIRWFQEKPVRWFCHFHKLISNFHLTLNLPSLTEVSALLQPLHFQTDLEIPSVNFVFSILSKSCVLQNCSLSWRIPWFFIILNILTFCVWRWHYFDLPVPLCIVFDYSMFAGRPFLKFPFHI